MNMYQPTKPILIVTGLCAGGFLFYPALAMQGAADALILWAHSVFPALFPFCAAVLLLRRCGGMEAIARRLEKIPLGHWIAPTLSAWCAGYPMGAILAAGHKDPHRRSALLALLLCAGPVFMLSTVGASLLGSVPCALVLLVTHYLAAILNALITGPLPHGRMSLSSDPVPSLGACLSESIEGAMMTLLRVLGIMSLVSAFVLVVIGSGAADLVLDLVPVGPGGKALLLALLTGSLEMSLGLSALAALDLPVGILLPAMAFLLGFGGMSVLLQAASFLPEGPGFFSLTMLKLRHGFLAAGLTALLLHFAPAAGLLRTALPALTGNTAAHLAQSAMILSGLLTGVMGCLALVLCLGTRRRGKRI